MEHSLGLGTRVKALRRGLRLSAGKLAMLSGVTENAIRKIESGHSAEPRFSTGLRMAKALGVAPEDLLPLPHMEVKPKPSMSRAGVLRRIRAIRPSLQSAGVLHLSLFGSVSRGEATSESDVDVIITPQPNVQFSLLDLVEVTTLLQCALHCRVDTITETMAADGRISASLQDDLLRVF